MIKIGLIGGDLSYTQSPKIYKKLLQKSFEFVPLEIKKNIDLPSLDYFFSKADYIAVTNPYKKSFIDQVDVVDESILLTGNLNCLFRKNKQVYGYNTDYLGFERLLHNQFNPLQHEVFLLGDGNLADSVRQALMKNQFKFNQFSRRQKNLNQACLSNSLNQLMNKEKYIPLIINTCSREFIFNFRLPYSDIIFWDLNYGIKEHDEVLSQKVKVYKNGLALLEEQAKSNLTIWNL